MIVSICCSYGMRQNGVLCDRKMPAKLKRKICRTVVRPTLVYWADTWSTTNTQENRLEVNEMRMLGWVHGVPNRRKMKSETNM